MSKLTYRDFAAFFQALWGVHPFPWQRDLVQRLATGKDQRRGFEGDPGIWPTVLDLPTGAGKTAAIDIAVFHLALEAAKREARRAPVRIAFVVDRRLIVDDAYERARTLARKLRDALDRPSQADPVVLTVARALCSLAGSDQPLIVRRLRGGAPREDDWARTPVQPTILCSTVDQVGSRLLFRGYGVSDSMKPIHAGLLGSDCLILLDEAHLSEPFRQTLHEVERLRTPDPAPFGFTVLTATPRRVKQEEAKEPPFGLSRADDAHPVLSRRITAAKPARLVEIAGDADDLERRVDKTVEEVKVVIEKLQTSGIERPAVGVILNRVRRARGVFERLRIEFKDAGRVILLIGPARAVDRDEVAKDLEPIRTGRDGARGELGQPFIVVATQTIEAGVDIDFDGLITETAALDALKQRFGRLNRAGRKINPEAVVLAHKGDVNSKADDPVYGDRIRSTWDALKELGQGSDVVDFGVRGLQGRIGDKAADLSTPMEHAPVLMPAYADLWSQTSPIPDADPEVALFLHGRDRSSASVQIVWRADIDEMRDLRGAMRDEAQRARLIELFEFVPPRAAEAIEVPLWVARAWLDRPSADQADFSDTVERDRGATEDAGVGKCAWRWAGEGSERTGVVYGRALRNGDLIVVPAGYGGCDQWGWNPDCADPVIDVAEKAASPYRGRRFVVRVAPKLIAQAMWIETRNADPDVADKLATLLGQTDDESDALLKAVLDFRGLPRMMNTLLDALDQRRGPLKHEFAYGFDDEGRARGVVFLAPCGLKTPVDELSGFPSTESEDLGALAERPIALLDHSEHVRDWAFEFAIASGLTRELRDDIRTSAYLHDVGKADPRYQAYYAGGDPYGPDMAEPLAKSGGRRLPFGTWERAGLPPQWRHEALSVRLAMLHPDFKRSHDALLVLWLIGTHHGHGRPLYPHADPLDAQERRLNLPRALGGTLSLPDGPGPQSFAFDFEGCDWPQTFESLRRRYGIWGLCRLEAFVRLADHRASESGAPAVRHNREAAE